MRFPPQGFGSSFNLVESLLALDVANVKDYGALGDGVQDDSTPIQDAINSGAKIIYFPSGTYLIGTTLTLPNASIQFVGCGMYASVINLGTKGITAFTYAQNPADSYQIVWRDLSVQGDGTTAGQIGLRIDDTYQHLVFILMFNTRWTSLDLVISYRSAYQIQLWYTEWLAVQGSFTCYSGNDPLNDNAGIIFADHCVFAGEIATEPNLILTDCFLLSDSDWSLNSLKLFRGYLSTTGPAIRPICASNYLGDNFLQNVRLEGNIDINPVLYNLGRIDGAQYSQQLGQTSTNVLVTLFSEIGEGGLNMFGSVRNTGALNSLSVEITGTDKLSNVVAQTFDVNPATSLQVSGFVVYSGGVPPYRNLTVKIKSTAMDLASTYDGSWTVSNRRQ